MNLSPWFYHHNYHSALEKDQIFSRISDDIKPKHNTGLKPVFFGAISNENFSIKVSLTGKRGPLITAKGRFCDNNSGTDIQVTFDGRARYVYISYIAILLFLACIITSFHAILIIITLTVLPITIFGTIEEHKHLEQYFLSISNESQTIN